MWVLKDDHTPWIEILYPLHTKTTITINLVGFFFFFTFWPTASSVSDAVNMFLFPEWELVTEPEELPAKDDKPSSDSLEQANIVSSGN